MSQSDHVLLISQDPIIQNLAEQVCRVYGYQPVLVGALSNAEAILAQPGQSPFALAVIDIRVLGGTEADILTPLPGLLQGWTTPPLTIPCLYLGSVPQKYGALAARASPVPFLTIPFSAHEFGEAVQGLVAPGGERERTVEGHGNRPSAGADSATQRWLSPPLARDVHRPKPSQDE